MFSKFYSEFLEERDAINRDYKSTSQKIAKQTPKTLRSTCIDI